MKRIPIALAAFLFACGSDPELETRSLSQAAVVCTTFQRGVAEAVVSDATIYQRTPTARDGTSPNLWTGATSSGTGRALLRWDLAQIPSHAVVLSANVALYVSNPVPTTVRVHRITAPWTETGTSWNGFADQFDAAVVAAFSTGGYGSRSFDLTAQVQAWVSGQVANDGVLLEEDPTTARTGYGSSENASPSRRPSLTVCWDDAVPPPPPEDPPPPPPEDPPPPPPEDPPPPPPEDPPPPPPEDPPPPPEDPPPPSTDAPAPPPGSPSLRIAVFGDYGTLGTGLDLVSAMVDSWSPDAIITTGDNVYDASLDPYDDIVGRHFHEYIGTYDGVWGEGSATNRFWPTVGNHDMLYGHLPAYLAFFDLPGNGRYYEAAIGSFARVFAYNSDYGEPDGVGSGSLQATWLRERLEASTACFDLVAMHEPPHASSLGNWPRSDLRFPYRTWGADVVLAGHMHGYERLLVDGFPHVIVGTGGGGIWGDWGELSPYSVYRYPVSETGWGAVLVTLRAGSGTGEMTVEFFAPGVAAPVDRYVTTKYCP